MLTPNYMRVYACMHAFLMVYAHTAIRTVGTYTSVDLQKRASFVQIRRVEKVIS